MRKISEKKAKICVSVFTKVRFYFFKNGPEGNICGKFVKKGKNVVHPRQVLIKSCGKFCLSVLLAYNAPSFCPKQNAAATAVVPQTGPVRPNRTSTAVCTAAAQAMNARRIERVVP